MKAAHQKLIIPEITELKSWSLPANESQGTALAESLVGYQRILREKQSPEMRGQLRRSKTFGDLLLDLRVLGTERGPG